MAQYIPQENERLDDLMVNGLKLIQYTDGYHFNSDSVLLSNLVGNVVGKTVADLGTGSGVIAVLLAGKHRARHVYAVELQPRYASLSQKNVALNDLENAITVINAPMQTAHERIGYGVCDVVVSNPPYGKLGRGQTSTADEVSICRHEIAVTLSELVQSADRLLRYGGTFCFIYKAERLEEVIRELAQHDFAVKELIAVQPRITKNCDTIIINAKKGGKSGMKFRVLTVFEGDTDEYTAEVRRLYNL